MRKILLLGLSLIGAGMLLLALLYFLVLSIPSPARLQSSAPVRETAAPQPERSIDYRSQSLPQGVVHTLRVPTQSQFLVTPAVAASLATVAEFAQTQPALAVLNGGYFDPANQQSTAYVTLNRVVVADPTQNDRLMQNPDLQPYLAQILNRSEFRRYQCGQTGRYAIARHRDAVPADCQLVDALGGGPQLLPELTAVQEGFVVEANGAVVRDAIGMSQPNARTAIGITGDGSVICVMVAQQPDGATGMTLPALADLLRTLGAAQALNLDGGSSASLHYQGETYYGKVDAAGDRIARPVKSVLRVQDAEDGRS